MSTVRFVVACSAFGLLVACGGSGGDGKSSITTLSPEAAGKECPAGGTRVSAGMDADGNGVLDPGEVTTSQVICGSGATTKSAETMPLTAVDVEAAGKNCKAGGVRIQMGKDANANNMLDAPEVTNTKYVCNGEAPAAGSNAVTQFDEAPVLSGGLVTVQKATIKAPGKGKVIAIANMDIFCASPALGAGYDCAAGITDGAWTMATAADASASSGARDYFFLTPNSTENASRTAVFDVPAAGDFSVYIRAQNNGGAMGFFRRQLTLVFIPS
jgi:hypothetical protein